MVSIAAIAVLATIICVLVVTFLGVFLYHIICTKPGDGDDAEAIRTRRKTPKKHNNIPMENIDSKSEAKRKKAEAKRLKKEEKERKKQEKAQQKQLEAEEAAVVMREKDVSRDTVSRMRSEYETMERDRQNRLSRVSEGRSSKKSNSSNNMNSMNRGSGGAFNYMAPSGDDYAVPKSNRDSYTRSWVELPN